MLSPNLGIWQAAVAREFRVLLGIINALWLTEIARACLEGVPNMRHLSNSGHVSRIEQIDRGIPAVPDHAYLSNSAARRKKKTQK